MPWTFMKKAMRSRSSSKGGAVKLVSTLKDPEAPFYGLYQKTKEKGLIDCVCQACSAKLGSIDEARAQGLPVGGDLMGHPSMEEYLSRGYRIITF